MNNDIKHLPNGDFEVLPEKKPYSKPTLKTLPLTKIEPPMADGRCRVLWRTADKIGWEHKGWLMPNIGYVDHDWDTRIVRKTTRRTG